MGCLHVRPGSLWHWADATPSATSHTLYHYHVVDTEARDFKNTGNQVIHSLTPLLLSRYLPDSDHTSISGCSERLFNLLPSGSRHRNMLYLLTHPYSRCHRSGLSSAALHFLVASCSPLPYSTARIMNKQLRVMQIGCMLYANLVTHVIPLYCVSTSSKPSDMIMF